MNKLRNAIVVLSVLAFPASIGYAAEMDHSQHKDMDHSTMQHSQNETMYTAPVQKGKLQKLPELPASGKAREAGSDGRYAMEPTSVNDNIRTKCAKATRGLVMVDNKTWAQCGGKPKGWSEGPAGAEPMDHSQHMMR